jgi:hypothetical protein
MRCLLGEILISYEAARFAIAREKRTGAAIEASILLSRMVISIGSEKQRRGFSERCQENAILEAVVSVVARGSPA